MSIKERADHIGYVMQNPNQMIVKPLIREEVSLGLVLDAGRELGRYREALLFLKTADHLGQCGLPCPVLPHYAQHLATADININAVQRLMTVIVSEFNPTRAEDHGSILNPWVLGNVVIPGTDLKHIFF